MGEPAVYKEEQDPTTDHDSCHEIEVTQRTVNMLLQQDAEYKGGDEGNNKFDIEADAAEIEEFLIIYHYDGQDGGQLDDDLEHIRKRGGCHTDDRVRELHMGSRRYGQEFCQSLHDR